MLSGGVYAGSRLVQEYFAEIGQLHKCQGYDLALFTLRSLKKYYRLLSRIYLLVKCNLVVYGFEPGGKRTKEFLEETMDLMERTQKRIDTFAEDHMDE